MLAKQFITDFMTLEGLTLWQACGIFFLVEPQRLLLKASTLLKLLLKSSLI
jgi:hypothetical protein